ncbi:MAG: ATP synthase F1 subunit delta [Saprospirales bacterium]|jgi:F-type H+-transporting ATPase subunit delta|nr:ATP synthase F1 subunit delta [Saprospirales bacterium]MBK8350269.1 ATP synthase F1 subunit delta [Saprospirales bacterium]
MSAEKLSIRYAKSLFDEATQKAALDTVFADLNVIDAAINSSKDLKAMYKSPIIRAAKKQTITTEIFGSKVSTLTNQFLELLINHGRETYIQQVFASFFKLYNLQKGISEVTVVTATELDAANEQKISSFIKAQSGFPNVKINKKVDASILGGFIVNFGDKQYDNSVLNKLNKIKTGISLN